MPGFTPKLTAKCAKLIYCTAAATLTIEEGIPFWTFVQPSLLQLFTPLNHESDKIVNLWDKQVRDAMIEMGDYAMEATKREILNHRIDWTMITGQVPTKQCTLLSLRIGLIGKLGS